MSSCTQYLPSTYDEVGWEEQQRVRSLSVEEWIAALPEGEQLPSLGDFPPVPAEPAVVRKKGLVGMFPSKLSTATDIYQLAQATRKARERQSRTSVVSAKGEFGDQTVQDRAVMMRTAYAAQRLDRAVNNNHQHPLSDGTFTLSFDSSNLDFFGLQDSDDAIDPAEELLLNLGFGGPSTGIDRVPNRFLQPSKLRGVDLEQLLAQQQEMDEFLETGSALGYRGLSGPSTRRPSSIVARLYERMRENNQESRRKSSGQPSNYTSFEHPTSSSGQDPPPPLQPGGLLLKIHEQQTEEPETLLTPTSNTMDPLAHEVAASKSGRSSLASSRKSSLRRQDRFNDDDGPVEAGSLSSGVHSLIATTVCQGLPLSGYRMTAPTFYVTPPPSFTPPEPAQVIDPILSVIQLAAEVYRVRLEGRPSTDLNCNHVQGVQQVERVRQDLRRELDKTDQLLEALKQRLMAGSASSTDSSANIRSVLSDMTKLLQCQQRLHQQVTEMQEWTDVPTVPAEEDESVHSSQAVECLPNRTRSNSTDSTGDDMSLGLEKFQRRFEARIRMTIRQELRRALHSSAQSRSKTSKKRYS